MKMRKKYVLALCAALVSSMLQAGAQVVDSKGMPVDTARFYSDKTDSLEATVFQARQAGNYLSRGKDIRTEVISSAGLRKLACCSLADSFENSASVTVGYSDAVTGARQIRLLGLSGSYTQMLDETRPIMRGILAPFGLSYVPGPWMESIQIAKGAPSVVGGSESMTGSINVEHRKPTDEIPLFLNGSFMTDTKSDFNVASSLQFGERWSTVLLGHVSGNFKTMDMNMDGFADDPRQLQFNVSNRWLYFAPSGFAVRFGVKAVKDSRQGGQLMSDDPHAWVSDVQNRSLGAYLKVGVPVGEKGSVALVSDYTFQTMDSAFGHTAYDANQSSGYLNLMYLNEFGDRHKLTFGASGTADFYSEALSKFVGPVYLEGYPFTTAYEVRPEQMLAQGGIYGEYTYHVDDIFSAIIGLRGDFYKEDGMKAVPRLTLKYSPSESITLRANGGRGLRYSSPVTDNIGILSTNKRMEGDFGQHLLEDAWIMGANATWYFGGSSSDYFSIDWFHTSFTEQQNIWHDRDNLILYNLSQIAGGRSFTDTYQADLSVEPFTRFTASLTFRYTRAMLSHPEMGLVEKPMTSRYKGVLNLQYATNLRRWIFDATASVNGPSRVYPFMEELRDASGALLYPDGLTPAFPLIYLQVTKRMKGYDIYVGGENLSGSRQKNVIIAGPKEITFDASQVWGPVMGARIYAGIRFTLWKTTKS